MAKKKKVSTLMFAVAALVLLVLAFLVLPALLGGGEKTTATTTTTAITTTILPQPTTTAAPAAPQPSPTGFVGISVADSATSAPIGAVKISGRREENQGEAFSGETNELGSFRAELLPGRYLVLLEKEGYFEKNESFSIRANGETYLKISLAKPETPQIPPAEIENAGFAQVSVIDVVTRVPLEGANVSLTNSVGVFVKEAFTSKDGTAAFSLPAGGYFVTASTEGYQKKKTSFIVSVNSTNPVLIGLGRVYS